MLQFTIHKFETIENWLIVPTVYFKNYHIYIIYLFGTVIVVCTETLTLRSYTATGCSFAGERLDAQGRFVLLSLVTYG